MRRHLFNLLTLVSLAAFLAAVTLWARSYFAEHQMAWERSDGNFNARASRGRFWLFRYTSGPQQAAPATESFRHTIDAPSEIRIGRDPWVERYWRTPVFTLRAGASPNIPMTYWDVIVPLWLPAALAAPLPLYALTLARTRRRRQHRARAGLCLRCGYDLRATPGRCPECGTTDRAVTAA